MQHTALFGKDKNGELIGNDRQLVERWKKYLMKC